VQTTRLDAPREIPRPAGENAGLRDDAFEKRATIPNRVVPSYTIQGLYRPKLTAQIQGL